MCCIGIVYGTVKVDLDNHQTNLNVEHQNNINSDEPVNLSGENNI